MPYSQPPRPAPPNGHGTCPRCGANVIWCVTEANRSLQAVDATRNERGNQAVRQDRAGRWWARQLTKARPTLEGSEARHMPHIATCANPAPPRPGQTPRRLSSSRVRTGVRPVRWQR